MSKEFKINKIVSKHTTDYDGLEPLIFIYPSEHIELNLLPEIKKSIEQIVQKSKQQSENKDYGKPIMFTTDDNVNIFDEEDEVWIVDRYWIKAAYKAAIAFASRYRHSDLKVFSTEEKAAEYVEMNKPLNISVQELMNRLYAYFKNPVEAFENLKHFSKQKIN